MTRVRASIRSLVCRSLGWLAACCALALGVTSGWTTEPDPAPASPQILTRDAAVLFALQNNPELAAFRQQRGVAAAAVVIAETYPFNPVWEAFVRHASGPSESSVTNVIATEHAVLLEIECRRQGTFRRQEANAGLARTDWEIVTQELALAVRVLRAFDTVLYRQRKLQQVERTIALSEEAARQVRGLLGLPKGTRPVDDLTAQSELADARAQLPAARLALEVARQDLRRQLGLVGEDIIVQGDLAVPPADLAAPRLMQAALDQRPDLRARQAAVAEAQARLRLEIANRLGNPQVGPGFEYDPTRVVTAGVNWIVPLPVLNLHQGQIQQREAERARAFLDLRQTEVMVQQDVQTAVTRLANARAWLDAYQTKALPDLRKNLEAMQKFLREGEPGIDALRVIDVRRKLFAAEDRVLDALYEVRQAEADLAAAVGDPSVAVGPCPVAAPPEVLPAKR
jgi:cobalt-zinc-cadmium efflux system outer membrane protein